LGEHDLLRPESRLLRLPTLILMLALSWCHAAAVFAQPDAEAVARRLLNTQGCKACHRIDDEGASFAPDLSQVGSRLNRAQLRAKLVDPAHRHAAGRTGDFSHLQDAEIEALTLFLSQRQ
jgi:cytochrome c553